MSEQEVFNKSIQLRVNDEFLQAIDDWQAVRGQSWSRSEAIRYLVREGIRFHLSTGRTADSALNDIPALAAHTKEAAAAFVQDADNLDISMEHTNMVLRLAEVTQIEDELLTDIEAKQSLLDGLRSFRHILLEILTSTNRVLIKKKLPPKESNDKDLLDRLAEREKKGISANRSKKYLERTLRSLEGESPFSKEEDQD
nr:ribbon-helix-helix domain-containing protein [uncultured Cohaesibacter sp.]